MENHSIVLVLITGLILLFGCQEESFEEIQIQNQEEEIQLPEGANTEDRVDISGPELTFEKDISENTQILPDSSQFERVDTTGNAELRTYCYYTDYFDHYRNGHLTPQTPRWYKWNPYAYYDAQVLGSYNRYVCFKRYNAHSSHQPDVICKLRRKTYGKYKIQFNMWVPKGRSAYFNLQKIIKKEWGAEVYFYTNGRGTVKIGGSHYTFYFPQNQWFEVALVVDLYHNQTRMYINGHKRVWWPCNWQSKHRYGNKVIEGINFYPYSSYSQFYIDKFRWCRY